MEHDKLNNPDNEGRIALLLLKGDRDHVEDVFLRIRDKKLEELTSGDYEKILAHKIVTLSSWGRLLETLGRLLRSDPFEPARILAADCRLLLECHEKPNKDLCPEFYDLVKGYESDTMVVSVEWYRPFEEGLKKYRTFHDMK